MLRCNRRPPNADFVCISLSHSPGLREVATTFFPVSQPMKPNNKSTASYPWKWILLGILLVVVACSWQNAKDSMTYNYKSIIENVREVQSKSGMEVESSTLESTGPELGLHNYATPTTTVEKISEALGIDRQLKIEFSIDDEFETLLETIDLF